MRAVLNPTRQQGQMQRMVMRRRYLIQGMCYAVGALRNVQREYLTRVDDKRDHARSDEYRDEN